MANLKKYDPRVDDLVMETRTTWDDEVRELTAEDRQWLARAIHNAPSQAANISYERSHTGFTRVIHVTLADIERVYEEQTAQ